MFNLQLPPPGLTGDCKNPAKQEKDFITCFSTVDVDLNSPAFENFAGIGPKRIPVFYCSVASHVIRDRILPDRRLTKRFREE